jgi:actin-like ATPase involved in cell morphogenesis
MSKKIEGQQIAEKAKKAAEVVAHAVEDIAEDVVEEIVDDSNLLLKKVKEFLPSRESAFKVIKVIAYWELVKLMLSYIL